MKPQQAQGRTVMEVQGAKPPEVLKILQFTIVQKGKKPTTMVHFYPFLTSISAQDHAKLGSGQSLLFLCYKEHVILTYS